MKGHGPFQGLNSAGLFYLSKSKPKEQLGAVLLLFWVKMLWGYGVMGVWGGYGFMGLWVYGRMGGYGSYGVMGPPLGDPLGDPPGYPLGDPPGYTPGPPPGDPPSQPLVYPLLTVSN